MKKPFVLIAAIIAVAGLGAAVAVAKEPTQVKTSVSIKFKANDPSEPYDGGTFSGQVKARKGCQKGRKVVLHSTYLGVRRGSDRSNNRGKYKIKWLGAGEPRFFVQATETRITDGNGDKVVCKRDKSKGIRL